MIWAVVVLIGVTAAVSCQQRKVAPRELSDDELLYQQSRQELPDQDLLEQQVEQYRIDLYVQTYLNQLLMAKSEAVTEQDCQTFFDEYGADMKLDENIVKGLIVKLPLQNRKNKELMSWLTQLSQGRDECMSELEQYCMQRAAHYDNFMSHWERLSRLTDQLPITVVEPRQFLAIKAYELSDQDYEYYFVVTDYRLEGERQPYEWAKSSIQELLVEKKRNSFRQELVNELRQKNNTIKDI